MNIGLSMRQLFWEMRAAVEQSKNGELVDFSDVNRGIEQLLHGAESCKEMIDNRRKISDKDFYNMLNEFASVYDWNDYDCYCVLEMAHNMSFVGEATIDTTMRAIVRKTEGHGRSFDWWDEEVGIGFKILYTKDFKINCEHKYTTDEIDQLIAEKKIILVSEVERSLAWHENNYKVEEYKKFDYAYDDYNMLDKFFNENGEYFPYTLKYIRKQLNSKKLKKLFNEHLDHTNCEIYEAVDGSNYSDSWSNIAKEYSKEFENQGYSKRLKRLNESKY